MTALGHWRKVSLLAESESGLGQIGKTNWGSGNVTETADVKRQLYKKA